MNYRDALKSINTVAALEMMGFEVKVNGSYVKFECACGKLASIKAYGDKKNLWFCPSCKKGGNIISLYMARKGMEYEQARDTLLQGKKKISKLTSELQLNYELEWQPKTELPKDICEVLGIGIPKGKTMLAGCTTFTIHDENGTKIAYYGIKNGKPIFHKSFSPELYLYNYHRVKDMDEVIFCTDIKECVLFINEGWPAVSNFGLPYLSEEHIKLLNKLHKIEFAVNSLEIERQAIKNVLAYYRFI